MPKDLTPQHMIRTRDLLVEPDGQKWTNDPPPPKYGVYTGTKEGDKKTSGKVICNFEKYVNYIAGWNYNLGGKVRHAICAVQLHLAHRES